MRLFWAVFKQFEAHHPSFFVISFMNTLKLVLLQPTRNALVLGIVKGAWLLLIWPTPFSWALNAEGNGFWPFSHLQPGGLAAWRPPSRGVGGSEVFGSFFRVESGKKKKNPPVTTPPHHIRVFKLASNVKKDTVASLIPLGNFLLPTQFLVHPRWKYKEMIDGTIQKC